MVLRRRLQRKVILAARVEHGYEDQKSGRKIGPGGPHSSNDFPEQFEQALREVIERELPSELEKIYDLEMKTAVIDVQYGSVTVFFSAVLGGLAVFSSYADFWESVRLVREHSQSLINRLLDRRYGGSSRYQVNVEVKQPWLPDRDDMLPWRHWRKRMGPMGEGFFPMPVESGESRRRDGFFWWLLITNVVLAVALAALVAGAVLKTYFPRAASPPAAPTAHTTPAPTK